MPQTPPAGFGASGNYYFGAMIDVGNAVAESDETNNQNLGLGIDVDQVQIDQGMPDLVGADVGCDAGARAMGSGRDVDGGW